MSACEKCHATHVSGDAVAEGRFDGKTFIYRTKDGRAHMTREEAQDHLCRQRVRGAWIARAATIPLTVAEPVPCHCGEVTLPVGVYSSICDGRHHAPAECKRCPA